MNLDWVVVSAGIGMILPVLIELFSKHVHGRWKIVIVFFFCLISAFAQYGLNGNFQAEGFTLSQFLISLLIILGMAVNFWEVMWKKWFPGIKDPIKINSP
jgi:hypothetical protein